MIPLLLALLVIAAGCARSSDSAGPTIAVVPKGQAHVFWQTVRAGAEQAGREIDARVIWMAPQAESDYSGQAMIVEDFINRRVSAIVLAPNHHKALVPVAERVVREGIPLVVIDSGIDFDGYASFIATDNYEGGVMAARRMGEALGGKGKVAIVGIAPGAASGLERERGFQDTIRQEFPGVEIVGYQFTDSDRTRGLAVAEDFLTRFPDLDGLFGSNESSAVASFRAVQNRRLTDRVTVVGFDASPDLLQALREGSIDSLVVQNPFRMGYDGVRAALDVIEGRSVPRRVDTGTLLVTRDNLDSSDVQALLARELATVQE